MFRWGFDWYLSKQSAYVITDQLRSNKFEWKILAIVDHLYYSVDLVMNSSLMSIIYIYIPKLATTYKTISTRKVSKHKTI